MPFFVINMQGLIGDALWASISNNSIVSIAHLLKHCAFEITGKVEFSLLVFELPSLNSVTFLSSSAFILNVGPV
jgi:hypothetical protein